MQGRRQQWWIYWSLLPFFCGIAHPLLQGINWFGMETDHECLGGLWKHSLSWYLEGLSEHGFQALRIPLCAQSLLENPYLSHEVIAAEPLFSSKATRYVDVLDTLIQYTASSFYLVLDIHRLKPAWTTPLWYIPDDPFWTYDRLWEVYDLLCERYAIPYSHVIGIDLFNEPHYMATFGDGNVSTDWRLFTQSTVQYLVDRYPVLFEHRSPDFFLSISGIDWGKNVSGVLAYPYNLSCHYQDSIVFSPHLYGPSLNYIASYEPQDLYRYWNQLFGDIQNAPLWIGEWGGRYNDPNDQLWMTIFRDYMLVSPSSIQASFFWALNPDSKDVDGILDASWDTWNEPLIAFLAPLSLPTH